jgi:hypothetical protein
MTEREEQDDTNPLHRAHLFVNENGHRIASDLNRLLAASVGSSKPPLLWAGYLSIRGLIELLPGIQPLTRSGTGLRLLCGVSPDENPIIGFGMASEEPDETMVRAMLRNDESRLFAEIDGIPVTRRKTMQLLELDDVLRRPGVQCRREEKRTFHAKGGALLAGHRMVVGSANLTASGLRWNREFSGHLDASAIAKAAEMCEQWWEQAVDFPLDEIIQRRLRPYRPELVYLKILDCLYGNQVDFDDERFALRPWQRDGVAHGLHILRQCGGVLLCDDVGIGKTDQALVMASRLHYELKCRVLVVCPANLHGWWSGQVQRIGDVPADIISYDRLARDLERDDLGPSRSYGIFICDEAHRLRNPKTKRARAIRDLMARQNTQPHMILLTATPVNNSALDLYELLTLADASLEQAWAPSHPTARDKGRGRRTGTGTLLLKLCVEPPRKGSTDADHLRAILDQRMVRRSRPQITSHYPESRDWFPSRRHLPMTYHLTEELRTLTGDVLDALGAGQLDTSGPELTRLRGSVPRVPPITLAMYRVEEYRLLRGGGGFPLAPLIRAMLLKRLESSPAAFAYTARGMARRAEIALYHLEQGFVLLPGDKLRALIATVALGNDMDGDLDLHLHVEGIDESGEEAQKTPDLLPAEQFDRDALMHDLRMDHGVLVRLAEQAASAIGSDQKSRALIELLERECEGPSRKKILVLTSSRRTAMDLYAKVLHSTRTNPKLQTLRDRMATTAPETPLTSHELVRALSEFTPETMILPSAGSRDVRAPDKWDLLIGTDRLSEGHNLQQAEILINYDLPWNPQMLGQRMGRLDRYGALSKVITCHTILPDTGLDLVLRLMTILQRKIDIAASTVGVSSPLLPGLESSPPDFTSALHRLDDDPVPSPLHSAAERRILLGKAKRSPKVSDALERLPPGAGAVHPTRDTARGLFCFRVPEADGRSHRHLVCLTGEDGRYTVDVHAALNAAETDLTKIFNAPSEEFHLFDQGTKDYSYLRRLLKLIDAARRNVIHHLAHGRDLREEDLHLVAWLAC